MNETLIILINQVGIMFLLMMLGYIFFKIHLIDENGTRQFSDFVLYIANPVIILQSLMSEFSYERLINGVLAAIISAAVIGLGMLLTRLMFQNREKLCQFGIIFSNVGFLGIPLVKNVVGDECVFYISIFSAVMAIFLWTYGIYLVTGRKDLISLKKVLTNPCIIMLVIGVIFFCAQVRLPIVINSALDALADCNTGIVMIVLGSYLAQSDLKRILTDKRMYFVCLFRLIIIPLITLIILSVLPASLYDLKVTMIIGAATPSAAILAMFCQKFGGNSEFGIGVVGLSTVFSLCTMPLFVTLLNYI